MAKLTLSFKDKRLKIYALSEDELVIGRDAECAIHIDSLAVSEQHARLQRQGTGYILSPMGEGDEFAVKVNSAPVTRQALADGDIIQVGKHTLTYSAEAGGTFVGTTQQAPAQRAPGLLQIQSGSHLGRTIRLDKAMTRVGKSQVAVAIIVRRDNGYFLSHLEGDTAPTVNGDPIDDSTHPLRNGDRIRIGSLELQFFMEDDDSSNSEQDSFDDEQRDFSRVHFEVGATLHLGEEHWDTQLSDISLHGALIQRPADWEPQTGTLYRLDIQLNPDVTISMDVHVAHSSDDLIGLTCDDIDVDSITHLRRLVELNLGDAELVERELSALG